MATAGDARMGASAVGTLALLITILGGLNWGVIGLFDLDPIAMLFGAMTVPTRAIYALVGVSALYCLIMLPRLTRAS